MKTFFISILLLAFSASNSFGFTEASCSNCSESQARAKARGVAPSANYQMHRVYVHDLETPAFHSYDVWHETEEGTSITLVMNAELPTNVQADWDTALTVQTAVIYEPFLPIDVAPGDFGSAYDAINDSNALNNIFHEGIADRQLDTTLGILSGLAVT